MERLEAILSLGNRWQKNGMDRIYINDIQSLYGLETNRYGSGNISSARLNGNVISNSAAKRIIFNDLGGVNGKLWYDVATQQWHGRGLSQEAFDIIVTRIKTILAELVAQEA